MYIDSGINEKGQHVINVMDLTPAQAEQMKRLLATGEKRKHSDFLLVDALWMGISECLPMKPTRTLDPRNLRP